MTLKVLLIIAVLTGASVMAYLWAGGKWIFRPSEDTGQSITILQSEQEQAQKVESELEGDLARSGGQG